MNVYIYIYKYIYIHTYIHIFIFTAGMPGQFHFSEKNGTHGTTQAAEKLKLMALVSASGESVWHQNSENDQVNAP